MPPDPKSASDDANASSSTDNAPAVAPPMSPIREAIAARMAAKKKAAAKAPPPPGRKAQELDTEAPPRSSRPPTQVRQGPNFTRPMTTDRK